MAEDDVAVAVQEEPVTLRLRVLQRSDGSPSHKRVRLSLLPAPVSGAADQHKSPLATAVLTATPDLFDATPGEATGVQPGRRKSSRSRVYSHRSSGRCKFACHASAAARMMCPASAEHLL